MTEVRPSEGGLLWREFFKWRRIFWTNTPQWRVTRDGILRTLAATEAREV